MYMNFLTSNYTLQKYIYFGVYTVQVYTVCVIKHIPVMLDRALLKTHCKECIGKKQPVDHICLFTKII